jgi:hypothetical protein
MVLMGYSTFAKVEAIPITGISLELMKLVGVIRADVYEENYVERYAVPRTQNQILIVLRG